MNRANDLGTNSRQVTEDTDKMSHGRHRWSGQSPNSRQAIEDGRHRQSKQVKHRHRDSRCAIKDRDKADKVQIVDELQKTQTEQTTEDTVRMDEADNKTNKNLSRLKQP